MLSKLLQKLLFVRQFNIDEGKIEILGSSFIMLDSSALLELQEIDNTKVYLLAKESSHKGMKNLVEHAAVYNKIKDVFVGNIAKIGKKIGSTDEGMIKTLQELFDIYGLGNLEILRLDNSKKQAILRIRQSSIALEYVKKKGRARNPVCTLTAGVLAGMFSYILNKNLDCIEKSCLAQGSSACEFVVN